MWTGVGLLWQRPRSGAPALPSACHDMARGSGEDPLALAHESLVPDEVEGAIPRMSLGDAVSGG